MPRAFRVTVPRAQAGYPIRVTRKYMNRRRGKPRRNRRKPKGRQSSQKRDIRKIKKQLKMMDDRGELQYRILQAQTLAVAENISTDQFLALNSLANLEVALGELRYYDTANPGTLLTIDGAVGAYSKDYTFVRSSLEMTIRSNYLTPMHVTVYDARCKKDTALTPSSAFVAGDNDVSNKSIQSISLLPTDVPLVKDLWKLKKLYDGLIQPGTQKVFNVFVNKPFDYNPSISDHHTDQFQKSFQGCGIYVRYHGALAHDTSLAEHGIQGAQIDYLLKRNWTIKYDAGSDIKFIFIDEDGLTAMANAAQVCMPGNPRVNITNPVNP